MSLTTTTEAELTTRTEAALTRTLALLRSVDPDLRLRDSEWTAGDVGAHLLDVLRRYTQRDFTQPGGLTDSPGELQEGNRSGISGLDGLPHTEVLDRLEAEQADYRALGLPLDERFPFHAGQVIDGAGARSNWMGELLLHGRDVAVAAGRPWPLEERDMMLILNGVLQVAPGWLDPTTSAGADLRVRLTVVGGTPQLFTIEDGTCVIRDATPADRPHAVIRARSTALALLLYQRISLADAVRRGVLVVGGSRPWRGLQLPGMFLPA
ncbi:MAG: hypothetical protein ACXVD0_07510 [Nocardioides sp.]